MFAILTVCAVGEEYTPSGIPLNDLQTVVDEYITPRIMKTTPSCVLEISKGNTTLMRKAYGYSDIGRNISATVDDLYEWGSVTKSLAHVSIMQLYEKGLIDFESDVEKYIGKDLLKKRKYKDRITILNLMHHNAGWDEVTFSLMANAVDYTPNLGEYLKLVEPRQFAKPNEYLAYSNYGATIEGYIVEKISGMSFVDYVHKNIFSVLGMNHTSIDPSRKDLVDFQKMHKAIGYMDDFSPSPFTNASVLGYPAGSALGTIEDLAKFVHELTPNNEHNSKLFQNQSTLELFNNVSYRRDAHTPGNAHGLWEDFYYNRSSSREHGGHTISFSAIFGYLPENGWSVCLFANREGDSSVTHGIKRLIFGSYNATSKNRSSKGFEGDYVSLRSVHNGFIKSFMYMSGGATLETISDDMITLGGSNLTEVEPYLYKLNPRSGYEEYVHLSLSTKGDGSNLLYKLPSDFIRFSSAKYVGYIIDYIILVLCILIAIVSLVALPILWCRNDSNSDDTPFLARFDKYIILSLVMPALIIVGFIIFIFLIIAASASLAEMTSLQNFPPFLITFDVLRWIVVAVAIIFKIMDAKRIKNEGTVNMPLNNLNDPQKSAVQKSPSKTLMTFVIISLASGIVYNIISYILDFYRI